MHMPPSAAFVLLLLCSCAPSLATTTERPAAFGHSTVKRQMMGGAFGGRNNPFQAYWYQGIVPGQGLPQIGMSAYGYGLPGLGLDDYLVPGAAILAGAGEGEIDDKDLDHLDEHIHGLDAIKGGGYEHDGHGDPDYPGHFKGEDGYDDKYNDDDDVPHHHYHHYHHNAASSLVPGGSQGVMAGMLCAVGLLVLV